jgi:polysaccharide export outer membrane protein
MMTRAARIAGIVAVLALEGCGSLSGAGPARGDLEGSDQVELVHVTPALAADQAAGLEQRQADSIAHSLSQLRTTSQITPVVLGAGAKLAITLWTYSPRAGSNGPGPTVLGAFTIDADGSLLLPYLARIEVGGLTQAEAQELIAQRYAKLGIFQSPSVQIDVTAQRHGQVLVTGAIGQPRTLPWTPDGITLAEGLTQALGDGATLLGQEENSAAGFAATKVTIYRAGEAAVDLPISVALQEDAPLHPSDRIVVKKAPAVEVTVLGPGMQSNGVYAFGRIPTLSEALARGAGLNANTANDRAVFVMREQSGQKPILYDFSWNRAEGLVASHRFPMQNGDLVYVAEAPIVPIQRVINILFQVALPAQLVK